MIRSTPMYHRTNSRKPRIGWILILLLCLGTATAAVVTVAPPQKPKPKTLAGQLAGYWRSQKSHVYNLLIHPSGQVFAPNAYHTINQATLKVVRQDGKEKIYFQPESVAFMVPGTPEDPIFTYAANLTPGLRKTKGKLVQSSGALVLEDKNGKQYAFLRD